MKQAKIADDLHRRLRQAALDGDTTLTSLVDRLLRAALFPVKVDPDDCAHETTVKDSAGGVTCVGCGTIETGQAEAFRRFGEVTIPTSTDRSEGASDSG